jgi:hypothetical protein
MRKYRRAVLEPVVQLILVCFLLNALCGYSSSELSNADDNIVDIRPILERVQNLYQQRLPRKFSFKSDYRLVSGQEGELASRQESREGEIRWEPKRNELICVDTKWNTKSGTMEPVRDEHSVYTADRTIGVRKFLVDSSAAQTFTTKAVLHDGVRPDFSGWFADGVLYGSEHLSDLLLASDELNTDRTEIEGQALLHVSGNTANRSVEAWLEPDEPYRLRKAIFNSKPGLFRESSGLTGATIEVFIEKYEEIAGESVPVDAVATYTYMLKDGTTQVKELRTRRTDLKLNPDFDELLAFDLKIANDTVVIGYDKDDEKYVWSDGVLRPFVDPQMDRAVAEIVRSVNRKPEIAGNVEQAAVVASSPGAPDPKIGEKKLSTQAVAISICSVTAALLSFAYFWYRKRSLPPTG